MILSAFSSDGDNVRENESVSNSDFLLNSNHIQIVRHHVVPHECKSTAIEHVTITNMSKVVHTVTGVSNTTHFHFLLL